MPTSISVMIFTYSPLSNHPVSRVAQCPASLWLFHRYSSP